MCDLINGYLVAAAAIDKAVHKMTWLVRHQDRCCTPPPDSMQYKLSLFESVGQCHHTRDGLLVNNQLKQIDSWFPKERVSQP